VSAPPLSRRQAVTAAILAGAVAARAGRAATPPALRTALVMGTGRPRSTYALYGPAWGRYAQAATGLPIAYRASAGATANIVLIEEGVASLGMTTMTAAVQAIDGTGSWTAGVRLDHFRALFPMYAATLQIVARHATGIATLADLAGRTIGIGPDDAATIPAILASLGIRAAHTLSGDMEGQIAALAAGQLDACAFMGEAPLPAITALARHARLNLIGVSAAEAAQVARQAPGLCGTIIQAHAYPGQHVAVASVGTIDFAICAVSLPDTLAASLTSAALNNRAALAGLVPAAAAVPGPAALQAAGIAFHPGALPALRAAGLI
jgi:TRAP transporter TAXI family solute receptor